MARIILRLVDGAVDRQFHGPANHAHAARRPPGSGRPQRPYGQNGTGKPSHDRVHRCMPSIDTLSMSSHSPNEKAGTRRAVLQRDPHESRGGPDRCAPALVGRRREELGLAARHERDRRAAPRRQPVASRRRLARQAAGRGPASRG